MNDIFNLVEQQSECVSGGWQPPRQLLLNRQRAMQRATTIQTLVVGFKHASCREMRRILHLTLIITCMPKQLFFLQPGHAEGVHGTPCGVQVTKWGVWDSSRSDASINVHRGCTQQRFNSVATAAKAEEIDALLLKWFVSSKKISQKIENLKHVPCSKLYQRDDYHIRTFFSRTHAPA